MQPPPRVFLLCAFVLSPVAAIAQSAPCRAAVRPIDAPGVARQHSGPEPLLRRSAACERVAATASRVHAALGTTDVLATAIAGVGDARGDGALWSGRGASTALRTAITADAGPVHLIVAPEWLASQNAAVDVPAGADPTRAAFSSPWYVGARSADLPLRHGSTALQRIDLGESALWISLRGIDAGWTASRVWWGPGVRDGLLFGPHAGGIPRVFLRPTAPITTRVGTFSGEMFVGSLTESRWFDDDAANDRRSIAAAAVQWQSRGAEPAIELLLSRAVQRVQLTASPAFGRAVDPIVAGDDSAAGMTALALRVRSPAGTMRAWSELVRRDRDLPDAPRGLLTTPTVGLGYLVGAEVWLHADAPARWRARTEMVVTEQGLDGARGLTTDLYTGMPVAHGWTQRGQLLGSGVGPGGNSQFIGVERLTTRWSAGGYVERVRWDNDQLAREVAPSLRRHDVTVRLGLTAGYTWRRTTVDVDAAYATRMNYLFQNTVFSPGFRTVDVHQPHLRLRVIHTR